MRDAVETAKREEQNFKEYLATLPEAERRVQAELRAARLKHAHGTIIAHSVKASEQERAEQKRLLEQAIQERRNYLDKKN